jgi:hypothetical protein
MSRVTALLRFVWDFVVGDDWRVAAAVVIAVLVTLAVSGAWWILPAAVAVILTVSVLSVAQKRG